MPPPMPPGMGPPEDIMVEEEEEEDGDVAEEGGEEEGDQMVLSGVDLTWDSEDEVDLEEEGVASEDPQDIGMMDRWMEERLLEDPLDLEGMKADLIILTMALEDGAEVVEEVVEEGGKKEEEDEGVLEDLVNGTKRV